MEIKPSQSELFSLLDMIVIIIISYQYIHTFTIQVRGGFLAVVMTMVRAHAPAPAFDRDWNRKQSQKRSGIIVISEVILL